MMHPSVALNCPSRLSSVCRATVVHLSPVRAVRRPDASVRLSPVCHPSVALMRPSRLSICRPSVTRPSPWRVRPICPSVARPSVHLVRHPGPSVPSVHLSPVCHPSVALTRLSIPSVPSIALTRPFRLSGVVAGGAFRPPRLLHRVAPPPLARRMHGVSTRQLSQPRSATGRPQREFKGQLASIASVFYRNVTFSDFFPTFFFL